MTFTIDAKRRDKLRKLEHGGRYNNGITGTTVGVDRNVISFAKWREKIIQWSGC